MPPLDPRKQAPAGRSHKGTGWRERCHAARILVLEAVRAHPRGGETGGLHHGSEQDVRRNTRGAGYVVMVAGSLIVAPACGGAGGGSGTPSESAPSSLLPGGGSGPGLPAQGLALDDIGFDFGATDAPIKVVEFSDFGCGYCRRFHSEKFPTLMTDYIETGKVQWKYVTFVSGMFPNGRAAALAGECVGEQGHFAPMSDLLYQRQPEWRSESDPADVFEALAVEAGAEARRYRECVAEERPAERLRSGFLTGARLGVRGTPTFIINGIPLVGDQPLSMWADIFTAIGAAAANANEPGGGAPPPEPRP